MSKIFRSFRFWSHHGEEMEAKRSKTRFNMLSSNFEKTFSFSCQMMKRCTFEIGRMTKTHPCTCCTCFCCGLVACLKMGHILNFSKKKCDFWKKRVSHDMWWTSKQQANCLCKCINYWLFFFQRTCFRGRRIISITRPLRHKSTSVLS